VSTGVPAAELGALLARGGGCGPYFALGAGAGEAPGTFTLDELYGGERILTDLLAGLCLRLGVGETRVAASLLYQGFASRISSPLLHALAYGVVVDVDPRHCHARYVAGEAMPLVGGRVRGERVDLGDVAGVQTAADLLHDVLIERHLRPLAEQLHRVAKLAPPIAWGNAASSISTAARLLAMYVDPLRAAQVRDVVDVVLDTERFAAGATVVAGVGILRRACCLYYRAPGANVCVDCPLPPRRGHHQYAG
jgi:ferric iron reductase protein FhuF